MSKLISIEELKQIKFTEEQFTIYQEEIKYLANKLTQKIGKHIKPEYIQSYLYESFLKAVKLYKPVKNVPFKYWLRAKLSFGYIDEYRHEHKFIRSNQLRKIPIEIKTYHYEQFDFDIDEEGTIRNIIQDKHNFAEEIEIKDEYNYTYPRLKQLLTEEQLKLFIYDNTNTYKNKLNGAESIGIDKKKYSGKITQIRKIINRNQEFLQGLTNIINTKNKIKNK